MKILICTSSFEKRTNGTAHFPNFALKINELYPQHEVRVVTDDVSQSYDKVFKVEFNYPRPVHSLYSLLTNFSCYKALKRIQKEYDFDIVVYNHAASGVWSRWFLPKRVKVIGFIHDENSLRFQKQNHAKKRHYIIHLIKKYLEKSAIKNFDLILCPSKHIRKKLITEFEKEESKIQLLYQSIDVLSINHNEFVNKINDPIKILFVKSNFIVGGLLDLIDAIKLLGNYNFELTVVGVNYGLNEKINKQISNLTSLKICVKGYCSPEEVYELMYGNDILCVPSRAEVLGLANVEGLAHGIRVVSTNVGGIIEVIDNGKNGWLAEAQNPDSLAKALKECIEADSFVAYEKKMAGRRFVEANFDYRFMLKRFVEICENEVTDI
jgi:colanic acid/amylovoran biosynthesis glycosyltransferase